MAGRTYKVATEKTMDVLACLKEAVERFHPWVRREKVTIKTILAWGPQKDGRRVDVAIKPHGHRALAMVKALGDVDRLAQEADVLLQIDADWWEGEHGDGYDRAVVEAAAKLLGRPDAVINHTLIGEPARAVKVALLDHELTHLQCKLDRDGVTKRREDGSVLIHVKPDDFALNGFYDVILRHRGRSVESVGRKPRNRERGDQLGFDFMREAEPVGRRKKAAKV